METEGPLSSAHPPANKTKPAWVSTTTLLVVAVLALASANVAMVTSDKAHDAGYSLLKAVLLSVLTDAAVTHLLDRSPTIKKQSDIRLATKTLAEEKAILSASKQALERKHAALEAAHKEIESKHADLKRASAKKIDAARSFTKKLASRVTIGASRAAATAIPKSVPFVGAGVVVTLTAYDLYDACQTMKEISELNRELGLEPKDPTKVCGLKPPSL